MRVIDLEAHFYTDHYVQYLRKRKDFPREEVLSDGRIKLQMASDVWAPRSVKLDNDLCDLGPNRMAEMDEAGIDKSVIFPVDFGVPLGDPEVPIDEVNKKFAEVAKKHHDRFCAFAGIDPRRKGARDLFTRCIEEWDMK